MISKIAGIVLSPFAGLKGDPLRGLQAIDILAISNQLYISKHTSSQVENYIQRELI